MVTAAVLTELDQPLTIRDDVEIEAPHAGEVMVRMTASAVCHSDVSFRNGTIPVSLPVVLGHEAAGVVEEVGAGVEGLVPGDAVVLSWVPQCGDCWFCRRGQRHLCQKADVVMFAGGLLDGTPRFRLDGQPLFQVLGTGTFAERTVVAASATVKLPPGIDPAIAALLGCSVVTGAGAALNTADIRPGDTVAVVGCGGVGLNVIQGACIAGAGMVIAIDMAAPKLELAERLGATHLIDASRTNLVSAVMNLTGQRGADVAFEVVGTQATIDQTVALTRRGGEAVLVGIPGLDVMLSVPAMQAVILQERTIRGCWYGSTDMARDVPRLLQFYLDGRLQLEPLVSQHIRLQDVNSAMDAMCSERPERPERPERAGRAGGAGRSVIVY